MPYLKYLLTGTEANLQKEKTFRSIQDSEGDWCVLQHLLGCCLLAQAQCELHGLLKEKKVCEAVRCFFRYIWNFPISCYNHVFPPHIPWRKLQRGHWNLTFPVLEENVNLSLHFTLWFWILIMVQNFITVWCSYFLRRMRRKALMKLALYGILFFFFKKKNMSNVKQFLLMTKQVTEEIIANLKCCDPAFVKS